MARRNWNHDPSRRPSPRQRLDIGAIYDRMKTGADPAYIEPPPPAVEAELIRELENESRDEYSEGRY